MDEPELLADLKRMREYVKNLEPKQPVFIVSPECLADFESLKKVTHG